MRILITGITGLIGRKLTEEMLRKEHEIVALVHGGNLDNSDRRIRYISGDLRDPAKLGTALAGERFDLVVHLAGITHTNHQNLYYQINVGGTKNLLDVCRRHGTKRFMYISSRTASVEGGSYAHSKLLAEQLVHDSGIPWVVLRLAEVYGAGEKEAISKIIWTVRQNVFIPVPGNGQCKLSPVFIDDIIKAMVNAAEDEKIVYKTYILAGPEELTYNEVLDAVSNSFGVKKIRIYVPWFVLRLSALFFLIFKKDYLVWDQIPRLRCLKSSNISLARRDLKYSPRGFREGLSLLNPF